MDELSVLYPIKRYENGGFSEKQDEILREFALSIYLDESFLVKLICMPEHLEELTLGYLYSEGLISSLEDVVSILFDGGTARVKLVEKLLSWKKQPAKPEAAAVSGEMKHSADKSETEFAMSESDKEFVTTDSGDFIRTLQNTRRVRKSERGAMLERVELDPEVILKNAGLLLEKSELFRKTGNVHSVMLCCGPQLLYFFEDIGRYNAFDKCAGAALKDGADLSRACVYTSGRIPGSVTRKVIRAGIPAIVSRSAPTDLTLDLAAKYGLTVVGFARNGGFNLYLTSQCDKIIVQRRADCG